MKPKEKKPSDSVTLAYQRLHGGRVAMSIRCKPSIRDQLKAFCETEGLSICHVFEMLVSGYLTGMKQKIDWVSQSPHIELTVVREVKRLRRYKREYVETEGEPRWYCALKCCEYRWDQLPSRYCLKCPNEACRKYVLKRVAGSELEPGAKP